MRIRQASIEDVPGIAQVHVASWKSTYRGMISDDYLNNVSVEKRINNWNWVFHHLNPDEVSFVLENEDGAIVGFSNGGKSRSEQYKYDAELYSIYLLKEYQGNGYGKALFSAIVNHLRLHKYQSLMVWVLAENPATTFYSGLGGKLFAEKDIPLGNGHLIEMAYGWSDLNHIYCSFEEKDVL